MVQPDYQVFVIAKPKGQQYRSLAAVRYQFHEGVSSLSTCHRLLRIFSDDANRIPIQQELAFADDFFGNASEADIRALVARNAVYWDGTTSDVPCPFPFITTCLDVGVSCNPDVEFHVLACEERSGMSKFNRGVTILDITELTNLRYCFLDLCRSEETGDMFSFSWEEILAMAAKPEVLMPLDGRTYLEADCDDSEDTGISPRNKAVLDKLENYSLVELDALADCWPDRSWKTKMTAVEGDSKAGPAHTGAKKKTVPSLRHLSQTKLFQELLSSDGPPDLELLDTPMLFSGFTRDLQRYLAENADALANSPAAVKILEKAFWGEKFFDFTPFQGKISDDDLVVFARSGALSNVKVANLSGFDSATDARNVAIMMEHLNLDSLYLLARPNRPAEDPSKMLEALSNCRNQPLVRHKLVLGSAFSRGLRQSFSVPRTPTSLHHGCWQTFPVIQLLYKISTTRTAYYGPGGSPQTRSWKKHYFLGDHFLTAVRFVTGLLNVIKHGFQNPALEMGAGSVSLNFARASSSFKTFGAATEVGPLAGRGCMRQKVRDIHPGAWTAVVVHTCHGDPLFIEYRLKDIPFQVALVRSKSRHIPISYFATEPGEIEVVDLKGFLQLTAPEHAGDLEACLSELTDWAKTDKQLVRSLEYKDVVSVLREFGKIHA